MKGCISTRVKVDGEWQRITRSNRATLGALPGERRYDVILTGPDGKQHSKSFDRKRDADQYLAGTAKAIHDGRFVGVKPTQVSIALDSWLADLEVREAERTLRRSTLRTYRTIVARHLKPQFGAVRSDRFSHAVVEQWRRAYAQKVHAGEVSTKSLENIRATRATFLRWCRHPAR